MKKYLLISLLFLFNVLFSQNKEQVAKIIENYDLAKIEETIKKVSAKEKAEREKAILFAKKNNLPLKITTEEGGIEEVYKIGPGGFLLYRKTDNVNAAISTRANFLHNGGGLGLNIEGQSLTARVWDGGTVRRSHSGFSGRVETYDDPFGSSYSSHATHVTGTIIASPWNGASANIKGMAPQAQARTFNWTNDESEALTEVTLGMLVSNHSYGVPVTGTGGTLPGWYIGSYVEDSRAWDEIAYLSEYYLPVFSAGNDGSNENNANPISFGYDKLVGNKVSKNVLTIANAQDASIDVNGNLLSVAINSSSSEGPTDDRRIKPDISGNGTNLTSLNSISNTSTTTMSGTSMAAPNVTGTLLLLQQYYYSVANSYMKASTLKGLACHTADDAGPVGPDAVWGWGLLNAKKAAETIRDNGLNSWLSEERMNQNETKTFEFYSDGTKPLIASITWTDVPGEANNGQRGANDLFKALVNDLDIRITKDGTTYFPWKLNNNPTLLAFRTEDNDRDNVEIVKIDNPASGNYTITITHKNTLVNESQDFAFIVTGISSNFAIVPNSDDLTLCSNLNATFTFNYKQSLAGTTVFSALNIPAGASASITPNSLSSDGLVTMTISNLNSIIPGEYQVGILGNNGSETESRYKKLRVFNSVVGPVNLLTPTNSVTNLPTTIILDWEKSANHEQFILQVSQVSDFSSTILSVQTENSEYLLTNLNEETTYYWRVIPSNMCGFGVTNNATIYSFTTGTIDCGFIYSATDFSNSVIGETANVEAYTTIDIPAGFSVAGFSLSLELTHTWIQDLTIQLEGPASIGSPIFTLLEEPCGDNQGINARFIDSGNALFCDSGIPSVFGDVVPNDMFLSLNGQDPQGTWTLRVIDNYNNDGGTIDAVSIEVCHIEAPLSNGDFENNLFSIYPNPAKELLYFNLNTIDLNQSKIEIFDIQGRKISSTSVESNQGSISIANLNDGVYILIFENGNTKYQQKLVVKK
jgi:subtilisin-like proprotein convertase family protein